jgi:hypothetical protein
VTSSLFDALWVEVRESRARGDHRALGIAKLDDGADANARLRTMIAVWRHNDRYRAAVDRPARTRTSRTTLTPLGNAPGG